MPIQNDSKACPVCGTGNGPDASGKVLSSEQLLGQEGRLEIEHGGDRYRLQRTRSGKLILTK